MSSRSFVSFARVLALSALLHGCVAEDVDYGTLTAEVVVLEAPADGSVPTPAELFGWTPNFSLNIPQFDSLNRAYIRDRTIYQHDIPGTLQRLRGSGWTSARIDDAIADYAASHGTQICTGEYMGGGDFGAEILIDRDDQLYTIIHVEFLAANDSDGCGPTRTDDDLRLLLLHSSDLGDSWAAYDLWLSEGAVPSEFAVERPHGPEPLDGPPALLLWGGDTTEYPNCPPPDDTAKGGQLEVVKPVRSANGLTFLRAEEKVSMTSLKIGSHSGGGTQLITDEAFVYVTYRNAVGDACLNHGNPVGVKKYEIRSDGLALVAQYHDLVRARPTNDSHNRGALVLDTSGYLHLVQGAHGSCPFKYARTMLPNDITSWTAFKSTHPEDNDSNDVNDLDLDACSLRAQGQTYPGFFRDRFDTLHLVFRSSGAYDLQYQTKPANAKWTPAQQLFVPPFDHYAVWYHKVAIDHHGWMYLLLSYATKCLDDDDDGVCDNADYYWFEDPGMIYKYSALQISKDGGASWQYGSTADFDLTTRWTPSSGALADVDGNGLKDAVHVYWKHGLTVHIDGSYVENGAWTWKSRGRRLEDGDKVLQYPVLAANVNPLEDNRDDLVFVYKDGPAGARTLHLRTHFAKANGHFAVVDAPQTDGDFDLYNPLIGNTYGDSNVDVVLMYRRTCGLTIRTKFGDSNGTWGTATNCYTDPTTIHLYPTRLGLVNNDGYADLVFLFRNASNQLTARVKTSNGAGGWTTLPDQLLGGGTEMTQYSPMLGDVDGDGREDLVFVFRRTAGYLTIATKYASTTGNGTFGTTYEVNIADNGQVLPHFPPMLGKANDDGCADIVLPFRNGSGRYGIRTLRGVCGNRTGQWQSPLTVMLP
jgi:hypothetical protein